MAALAPTWRGNELNTIFHSYQHTKVKLNSFLLLLSWYQMHLIQHCHVSESVIFFLPHLHTFLSAVRRSQPLLWILIQLLLLKICLVQSADSLWMSSCSAGLMCVSPCRHANNLDSQWPRVNTPQGQTSKTHKAWSINYSEWHINVFYNSALAFHYIFTWREEKQKCMWPIMMHFISHQNKHFTKLNGNKYKEEWQSGHGEAVCGTQSQAELSCQSWLCILSF